MSTTIAATLAARRVDLERAVDALTDESKVPAPTAEDPDRIAVAMPMLSAIEDAQTSAGRRVRAPMSSAGRAPGWITAVALLVDVDQTIGPAAGSRAGWSRARRLRAWAARVSSSASLDHVAAAADRAAWWLAASRALFAPPRWLPLRGSTCPDCGHEQVVDDDGVITSALMADTEVGSVECIVDGCGATWPAEHLHLLARALGVQTATEVLAVDP